jgi:tryptophan synthase beta chain
VAGAAGTYYHYLDNEEVNIIAVEAAGLGVDSGESATSVLGKGVIHGAKTLLMQSTDGQITEPYSISAGLDYPGVGPCTPIFTQQEEHSLSQLQTNKRCSGD